MLLMAAHILYYSTMVCHMALDNSMAVLRSVHTFTGTYIVESLLRMWYRCHGVHTAVVQCPGDERRNHHVTETRGDEG